VILVIGDTISQMLCIVDIVSRYQLKALVKIIPLVAITVLLTRMVNLYIGKMQNGNTEMVNIVTSAWLMRLE
jgi:hypothetical protein